MKLRGLDLFSGIGGLALALDEWVEPVAYCENDRYAQSVLLSRMHHGTLPLAAIWDDVRTYRANESVDIVSAGFPCQDLSAAGRGKGLVGERSGLYFEIERIVREAAPTFVFLENVPAIRTRGLGRVVWGLSELGYDLRWTVVSAAEVGAPHLRKRWFMLAYRHGRGFEIYKKRDRQKSQSEREQRNDADGFRDTVADATIGGRIEGNPNPEWSSGRDSSEKIKRSRSSDRSGWWSTEPDVGRVAHGVSQRVDRLRCLGNAVVAEQAKTAFKRLIGLE